jgi:hypothetical protein
MAVKNYIEGAEIITPQAKKIIDDQKKSISKFYKNFYNNILLIHKIATITVIVIHILKINLEFYLEI